MAQCDCCTSLTFHGEDSGCAACGAVVAFAVRIYMTSHYTQHCTSILHYLIYYQSFDFSGVLQRYAPPNINSAEQGTGHQIPNTLLSIIHTNTDTTAPNTKYTKHDDAVQLRE